MTEKNHFRLRKWCLRHCIQEACEGAKRAGDEVVLPAIVAFRQEDVEVDQRADAQPKHAGRECKQQCRPVGDSRRGIDASALPLLQVGLEPHLCRIEPRLAPLAVFPALDPAAAHYQSQLEPKPADTSLDLYALSAKAVLVLRKASVQRHRACYHFGTAVQERKEFCVTTALQVPHWQRLLILARNRGVRSEQEEDPSHTLFAPACHKWQRHTRVKELGTEMQPGVR